MSGQNTSGPLGGRWFQLLIGIVCMSMIANLQYGWTLFVNPIDAKFGWGRAAISLGLTGHGKPVSFLNTKHRVKKKRMGKTIRNYQKFETAF